MDAAGNAAVERALEGHQCEGILFERRMYYSPGATQDAREVILIIHYGHSILISTIHRE